MDRNKVSTYDREKVVVDGEDTCSLKRGVYQSKEYLLLKRYGVRLWLLGQSPK